jgi:thioesterase domain-containing protein/acyl carrier protein
VVEVDDVERRVIEIWQDVLGLEGITPFDDFFELGGTSLQAGAIVAEIESRLGAVIPLSAVLTAPTVQGLAEQVRATTAGRRRPILIPLNQGPRPSIFAIPGGGGGVFEFRSLAHHLERDSSFFAFEARAADAREHPYGSVEEMAADYLREMTALSPGPYLLIGHSFGGVVAYEMAAQLVAAEKSVAFVVLLDTLIPTATRQQRDHSRTLGGAWRGFRRVTRREWHRIRGWAHLAVGLPIRAHSFHRYLMIHARSMTRRYKAPSYDGRVDYFHAVDDPRKGVTVERWKTLVRDLHVHELPGTHFDLLVEPAVTDVADQLRALMTAEWRRRGDADA